MRELHIDIPVTEKSEDELNPTEARLLAEAKAATQCSYAPYSHFYVGAAALLADGTIVSGSNQENSASPSGTCAERTAVFYANSRYPDQPVEMLCVAARDASGAFTEVPVPPCGSCRQVLSETEARYGHPLRIMLYGRSAIYFVTGVRSLLPLQFSSSFLK